MDQENENQVEASAKYNLRPIDDNFKIQEECILEVPDLEGPKGIHTVKFNYNDQYVAGGYRDGCVRIFNMLTKQLVCTLNCNEGSENKTLVQVMKWRPKIEGRTNNILMSACKDTINEWHFRSRQAVYTKQFTDNIIYSMDYSRDGTDYALGFKDFSIRVYDGVKREEKIKLGGHDNHKVTGHMDKILAIKYHKDNPKILMSGSGDGNVLVWDLTTEAPINIINGPVILGEGLDMDCFGNILTASWRRDNNLQIWNLNNPGQPRLNIDWNQKEKDDNVGATQLYTCKYSNDFGKFIFAGGSHNNTVKIFDWSGSIMAVIDGLSHPAFSIDPSNDISKQEKMFAIGGGEGAIRVFRYSYAEQNN